MASELARARTQLANHRRQGQEMEGLLIRKAVLTISAAGMGFAESKGVELEYGGVPTKLALATVGSLFEAMTRDRTMRRVLGAFSDANIAAYAYAATKSRAFVAGGEGGSL